MFDNMKRRQKTLVIKSGMETEMKYYYTTTAEQYMPAPHRFRDGI